MESGWEKHGIDGARNYEGRRQKGTGTTGINCDAGHTDIGSAWARGQARTCMAGAQQVVVVCLCEEGNISKAIAFAVAFFSIFLAAKCR